MIEIQAPNKVEYSPEYKIFLAGSIEMGVAENWQTKIVNALKDHYVTVLNPRRDDWDSSWKQTKDDPQFREQVLWELNALDSSDLIVMYFDPLTKSPISLLELGLFAPTKNMLVCCPTGFWKKGNVDIVCEKFGISTCNSLPELIDYIQNHKRLSPFKAV